MAGLNLKCIKCGKSELDFQQDSRGCETFKIFDEKMNTLLDVQGEGKQVIGAGSINPETKRAYKVFNDVPIAFIPYSELKAMLMPYDKSPKKIKKPEKQYVPKGIDDNLSQEIMDSVSIEKVLESIGIDISKNPTDCFTHSSEGGKCLGFNDDTAHCFHCDKSWNKYSLIRDAKNLTDKQTFEWFAEKCGKLDELNITRKKYVEENKEHFESIIKDDNSEFLFEGFNKFSNYLEIAKEFIKIQPIYYDASKIWWVWNHKEFRWQMIDETDLMNAIDYKTKTPTVESKTKSEITEALKRIGRLNKPKDPKLTWIQFKDKIMDIISGDIFNATSEYFITNPIPYEMNKDNFMFTPTMDRIFEEWVGKDYVKTLYEIIAYCLLPDYPMNRLFCFIGSGMNGKSKFLELVTKFLGKENCSATELDILINSRFEITRLHKKLVCQMGETNFNEMKKTSILKKLTGGDLIGFEYKNKDLIQEKNYAKILISTNSLPTTDDKTIGFYRRWLIVDFPNQFSEKKDILVEIPEEEYSSLALKCCGILKDLLEKRQFHNEGSIEDRKNKFESKSDFLQHFLKEYVEEGLNSYITKADFYKKFVSWCKENRHRELAENSVGKKMKEKGFEAGRKYVDWLYDGRGGQLNVWLDKKWKE